MPSFVRLSFVRLRFSATTRHARLPASPDASSFNAAVSDNVVHHQYFFCYIIESFRGDRNKMLKLLLVRAQQQ